MKKIILMMLCVALLGCRTVRPLPDAQNKNIKCKNIPEIEVYQLLDGFALAAVCEKRGAKYCDGALVRINEYPGDTFYENMRIVAPKDKCFVYNGAYRYKNKQNMTRTIPVVEFDYMYKNTGINNY